jgi:hypothetical protein
MYILKCQVVSTKQMDFWEIFGRSGAVSNLSGSNAGIYSHYRITILKELIRERARRDCNPACNGALLLDPKASLVS